MDGVCLDCKQVHGHDDTCIIRWIVELRPNTPEARRRQVEVLRHNPFIRLLKGIPDVPDDGSATEVSVEL